MKQLGWIKHERKTLKAIDSYGNFYKVLERAYGASPWYLNSQDLPVLFGMYYAGYAGAKHLMQAIKDNGTIYIDVVVD